MSDMRLIEGEEWYRAQHAEIVNLRTEIERLLGVVKRLQGERRALRAALNSVRTDVMQRRLRLPTETYAQVIAALADEQKADAPSLQDMDDEIQASEREFRPMRKTDTE